MSSRAPSSIRRTTSAYRPSAHASWSGVASVAAMSLLFNQALGEPDRGELLRHDRGSSSFVLRQRIVGGRRWISGTDESVNVDDSRHFSLFPARERETQAFRVGDDDEEGSTAMSRLWPSCRQKPPYISATPPQQRASIAAGRTTLGYDGQLASGAMQSP